MDRNFIVLLALMTGSLASRRTADLTTQANDSTNQGRCVININGRRIAVDGPCSVSTVNGKIIVDTKDGKQSYDIPSTGSVVSVHTFSGLGCSVMDDEIYKDGKFLRNLTFEDREKLADYGKRVAEWNRLFQEQLQQQIAGSFFWPMRSSFSWAPFGAGFPFWSWPEQVPQRFMRPMFPFQSPDAVQNPFLRMPDLCN